MFKDACGYIIECFVLNIYQFVNIPTAVNIFVNLI